MPNLDPHQLANDVLDQARMIRELRDRLQNTEVANAQLRDGWNDLAMVKARYDELKGQAEAQEAREVAAAITAEKPAIATAPDGVGSTERGKNDRRKHRRG